jgi:predicted short-subunit dehydrogenase-like oxidoreductase (DUF2520 family)
VATVLARKMLAAGHELLQVFSRTALHAQALADDFDAAFTSDWAALNQQGELYLVALNDSALYELGSLISLEGKLVAHTAGSVSKDVLKSVSSDYGVCYPLQSLRKELETPSEIPLLIDGNKESAVQLLLAFAATMSNQVLHLGDEARKSLHLAAIVANNFSNHLYALAEHFCKKEKTDFQLLLPLIRETASRLEYVSPTEAQTGPAIRGDWDTIQKHLLLLESYPPLREVYQEMTASIESFKYDY